MACEAWQSKLQAYVDGELPAAESEAFETHQQTCAACSVAVSNAWREKEAIRRASSRYRPSAEFRRRVEKSISRRRVMPALVWVPWLAATAGILVVIAFGAESRQSARRQVVFAEIADLHVATLASANAVDVVSSDRHTVKPWFEGKIPFTFNLPDLSGTPYTLLGGRVVYLNQTPGAGLLFQIRLHRISVYIFQDREEVSRGLPEKASLTPEKSFTLETWAQKGLRYFIVSDVSAEDVRQLGELLRRAAGS